MHGNHRRLLQSCRALMAMAALVLLVATVSHAQVTLDQLTTQTLDSATSLAKPKPKPTSVPEPNASVLLLLGLGGVSLGRYWMERRKRVA